jgi:excisionase family DNA binding protein
MDPEDTTETPAENHEDQLEDTDDHGPSDHPDGRLLSATEAAEWLGVADRSVRRMWSEGRLPYVRVRHKGRHVRFEDLRAYAEGRPMSADGPRTDQSESGDSTPGESASDAIAVLQAAISDAHSRLESAQTEAFEALRDLAAAEHERGRLEARVEALETERDRLRLQAAEGHRAAEVARRELADARRPRWRRWFGRGGE